MPYTLHIIATTAPLSGVAFVLGVGLMAVGFLAVLAGFFMAMMNTEQKFEQSSMIFVLGIVALVLGGWLMRFTP